ncbi:MAG: hypothetical protein MMC23_003870 [Stictis urceolatum]|nr:hypothetical protein [Stictis urceolata]
MAYQDKEPYISQDHPTIARLLQALEAGKGKFKKYDKGKGSSGFKCKKSTFSVDGTNGVTVDSWKFNDWDYKRDDLPTYARGLFTYKNKAGYPEIVTRGYDKFFNIEEVNDTKWRNVEQNTRGPYELSVKENGCIIFLSGLEDGKLLVCSKHSTGARADASASHAVAGERWVDRHLTSVGKNRSDLANELRKNNVTAVAELCDDAFEEHVLAYDEKSAGLYLHGINVNVPEFATYSGSMVHKFADQWGFKKAQYLIKDDLHSVKKFLDQCAETGSYEGRDTEGFVIRCQKRAGGAIGPYDDWFFKYKFDEPYLMYRQWREATKAVIAGRAPKYRKHAKITEQYLLFARRRLAQNQGMAKAYQNNHGIIKMRDDFLKELGVKGSDIIRQEHSESGGSSKDTTNNIVLVPVATIGCGKTTVALALVKLFEWGHIQNDNITQKKNRPQAFATQITNALALHPVVIADRNNHQKRERKQLTDDLSKVITGVRFVALQYVHHPKHEKLPAIRKATQDRVLARGDNHQTIQAASKDNSEIIGIMEGFCSRFEPVEPDSEPDVAFDEIIDLDPVADSRHNLELVVDALRHAYPKLIPEPPSPDALDAAIHDAVIAYTVDLKHDLSFKSKNKDKTPTGANGTNGQQAKAAKNKGPAYFALQLPTTQVRSTLDRLFSSLPAEKAAFYTQLSKSRRIQPSFHVTLAHRAQIKDYQTLWDRYMYRLSEASRTQDTGDPKIGMCKVRLESVVWNARVMCFVVKLLDQEWNSMAAAGGNANHVTVGTADPAIKPKESGDLVRRWEAGESVGEVQLVGEGEEGGGNELVGEVRAVFQ